MILVIDDDPTQSFTLSELLKKFTNVIVANDGEDGYSKLLSMTKDGSIQGLKFVITDLQMPKIDGFGFTRLTKANIDTKIIPIFGYTATPIENIINHAKSVGMEDVFYKSGANLHIIEELKLRSLL